MLDRPQLRDPGHVDACSSCGTGFGLFGRKSNCYNCGRVVDNNCLHQEQIPLDKFGYTQPVSVCKYCIRFIQIQRMPIEELRHLSVRQLKEFINAYGLHANGLSEKEDLVRLIVGTILSNEHERQFRSGVPNVTPSSPSSQPRAQQSNGQSRTSTNGQSSGTRSRSPRAHPPFQQEENTNPIQQFFEGLLGDRRTSNPLEPVADFFRNIIPNVGQDGYPGNQSSQQQSQQGGSQQQSQQPQQQSQQNGSQSRQPSPVRQNDKPNVPPKDEVPTIDAIIRNKLDITSFSAKTLKAILQQNDVSTALAVEKQELLALVQTLIQNIKLEQETTRKAEMLHLDDELCKVQGLRSGML
ncbi:hypothetical protein EDD86DRAFT_1538 [Gorgonomyces haynaldii]|nr:hypothetical protein EDD86DRAFT_1538 [Gorgonomyces haynaldii]